MSSRRILSGWRDLNPRPLDPQSSALPSCATARSAQYVAALSTRITLQQPGAEFISGRTAAQRLRLRFSRTRMLTSIGVPSKPKVSRSRRVMKRR